ncbi:MarR family winged helix-turn-helix transcriptional regulator [Stomatohabitans albus]|uniref:MarR family winged helix-turn-helix transcriptional regulator n=1 Tax=Stomatohabitans albus TaxID=3110766 RepID=UPI00300C898F
MATQQDWQMWRDYLFTASRILASAEAKLQAEGGLSLSDYDILVTLFNAPEHTMSMSCLKATVLVTTSGLSRSVSRLQKREWVEKTTDENDRRQVHIALTAKGLMAFKKVNPGHIAFVQETFFKALSEKDRQGMCLGMSHLADHLK